MVRASRNVSNLRRAADGSPGGLTAELDHLFGGGPGSPGAVARAWTAGHPVLRGALPGQEYDPAAPGAKLDHFPWARSWTAFLAALRSGDMAVWKPIANAMTERRLSEGGALLPESLRSEVLAYLAEAVLWPRCMVVPAPALRMGLPSLDNPDQSSGQQGLGGVTFSVVEDGQPIPASAPKFGRTVLEAVKVAALIKGIPNELLDDAAEAMSGFLGAIIGLGYAWQVDDWGFNGTGVGQPQGLLYSNAAYAVTRNTASAVLHSDVVAMLKAAHPASKKHLLWAMSEDVFDFLLNEYEIVGTAPSGQDVPPPNTLRFSTQTGMWELLGVPAEVTDHQPQIGTPGDLILIDPRLYVYAQRDALTVELSSKGAGFAMGTTDARLRGRLDGRYWPASVYTLRNGRQCSPLVVLN